MNENYENHLEIYPDRSELHIKGHIAVYYEGFQTRETQERYKKLNQILTAGYLPEIYAKLDKMALEELSEEDKELLRSLVQGVTSEVGRALVGVAFLQLTIKSIVPEQNIRLHKGTTRNGSFSWKEGISMRTLDASYSTPFLREYGLLNVNKYGVFMTRSLAENYPYSSFYKAEMRGPFEEWIDWQTSRIPAALLKELGYSWLLAVVESFGQRRLDLAPIDEPCEDWIKDLRNGLKEC